MNYNPTTRILTIDNYYDLVKFARKQDWEFDCNQPKKIIIDVYDVLDPISPKDVDNLMDKKVFVMRYKNAASAKRYLTRMAEDIAKRAAEKNEEKFVQMLNAVEWSDTALRRMLPAVEESELQIAKAYILEKIRTKETFEV